jgi:hypothetical protein
MLFFNVLLSEFMDSRNVQVAIHMADLMYLERTVTKKYYILV